MKNGFCLGLAPADEGEPPAGFEARAQVGERFRRVGEEHHAEPRDSEIGGPGREAVDGGVGKFEPDRQGARRALPGAREHRLGKIDAQDFAAGRDASGEVDRGRPAAAADVDHPLAGLRIRRGDEPVGNRAQHLILMFLMVGPFPPGGGIPVFGLRGIVGVDWRGGHGFASSVRHRASRRTGFRHGAMGRLIDWATPAHIGDRPSVRRPRRGR